MYTITGIQLYGCIITVTPKRYQTINDVGKFRQNATFASKKEFLEDIKSDKWYNLG
jgi:hypothetical protein